MKHSQEMQYRAAEQRLWTYFRAKPTEQFLALERPRVRVRLIEVGEGKPILFLHGGPNAGSTWAPLVTHLQDFRCLILDRPGCGLSEPVNYSSVNLRSLAVDVISSVLNALNLRQTSIIGSSIGGTWAFWFARAKPERVSRIVQEGCPALVTGMQVPPFMRLLATPWLNRMTTLFPSSRGATRMIIKQVGHGASLREGQIPEVLLDWNCALMNDTNTMSSELGMIERGLSWRGGIGPGLEFKDDELAQVEQPTLFLWGEDDPFGSPELGRRLAGAMPKARIQVFVNSGHLPWLDQPEEHAARIHTFLGDRTSSAV